MKFIVNDKIYDTEKAEKVLDYRHRFPLTLTPQFCIRYDMELFRTAKGNWFSVRHEDYGKVTCITHTVEEAKEIFKKCNRVELYAQYFGNLEEA